MSNEECQQTVRQRLVQAYRRQFPRGIIKDLFICAAFKEGGKDACGVKYNFLYLKFLKFICVPLLKCSSARSHLYPTNQFLQIRTVLSHPVFVLKADYIIWAALILHRGYMRVRTFDSLKGFWKKTFYTALDESTIMCWFISLIQLSKLVQASIVKLYSMGCHRLYKNFESMQVFSAHVVTFFYGLFSPKFVYLTCTSDLCT